tara:strand:- start:1647 stop:1928 length:282 start_codon:yes stop_codon:yes gene_type:complete
MAIAGIIGRQLIKLGIGKAARKKIKKHIQKGNLRVSGKEIKMTPKGSYKQESSLYREANPRKDIPEGIMMKPKPKPKPKPKKKVVKKKKRTKQ